MHVNTKQYRSDKPTFAFERLDAYKRAREFLDIANMLVKRLPKVRLSITNHPKNSGQFDLN